MPAVELSGVTKRYGVRQALCDVNLSLEQGSALGLLGPNGAGKTTALRLMLGFARPTRGQVRLHGRDPADPEVMLGPVIRAERRDAIEEYIDSGKTDGAELATGGRRPAHLERGYFIEPPIFDMRIAREEIFGPVVSVIPFEDEEDAIRIANDSDYGLFGGIATAATPKATEHAREMAKRIRTGGISINGAVSVVHSPFGGFKQSGLGREGGMFGIHEFTEVQSITWSA